jgi:hypothetical protein
MMMRIMERVRHAPQEPRARSNEALYLADLIDAGEADLPPVAGRG